MILDRQRTLVFLAKVWCVIVLLLMLYADFADPRLAQTSDYVMTFYVAGHLAATDQTSSLYPSPDAASFTGSSFDQAAHSLLPYLPGNRTAAYMYSPLVAWIFAPLSFLKPNLSLLVWQILSLVGLAFSCHLLSQASPVSSRNLFFLSLLYFPVFITLWIGQLGITFGLLPLCVGYILARRTYLFAAGLVWSLLALKPQFLPVAGLVGVALAMVGQFRCLLGTILGIIALAALNLIVLPLTVTFNWLISLRVSDAIFSSGLYGIPTHLITSLPADLLMLFPVSQRQTYKLSIYSIALGLGLIALWQCRRVARSKLDEGCKISLVLTIGLILLPLVSPHMLYYDLCLLLPAGMILSADEWQKHGPEPLRKLAIAGWASISSYMLLFLSIKPSVILPLLLLLILLASWITLLINVNRICSVSMLPRALRNEVDA